MKVLILACLLVAVFAEPAVYFREKFEGIYAIPLQKYDAETVCVPVTFQKRLLKINQCFEI